LRWSLVVVLAVAAPVRAGAAAAGDAVVAVRREGTVQIDGVLDEAAWKRAPVFDGFVQLFPKEGEPPSERTEVRVLFDEKALYVGVRCLDSQAGAIVRTLGRRDASLFADQVLVLVDSTHEGRTGYAFLVNAAGVQQDGMYYNDDRFSTDWDAVWEAAVSVDAGGWSAELMIPLTVLRFSDRPVQTWGFGVRRTLARLHEDSVSVLLRRSQRGVVSRLAPLTGVDGLRPRRDLELTPYVTTRVSLRPQYPYTTRPYPRLTEPSADLGLDLRASIGRGLALQATINPDFGQVEADTIIQNLSRYETFFPEKRPFFLQGMDLFQAKPGGSGERESPQQMFYSRRVGLDAPILAAAKLTGQASDDIQVGLLDAVVTGAGWPGGLAWDTPPQGVGFSGTQPLHVGAASGFAELEPASRNIFAGLWRWQPGATRDLGLWMTSAVVPGRECTPAEAQRPYDPTDAGINRPDQLRPRRCEALAANAVAVDGSLRSDDGEWFVRGQATGSQWMGRAPMRALADGTVLRPADTGFGWYLSGGKQEGEPWRFEAQWYYESPKLELNAVGFQRTQNEQFGRALVHWIKPSGIGPFLSLDTHAGAETGWTTASPRVMRSAQIWTEVNLQLKTFQWIGCYAFYNFSRWDVREIDRSGIFGGTGPDDLPRRGVPYQRQGDLAALCWFSSDPSGGVVFEVDVLAGRNFALGPLAPAAFWQLMGTLALRPHERLETRLELKGGPDTFRARWVDDNADGSYLFADLSAPSVSVTLRQQVLLSTTLTLQAYAQLFLSYGRYGPFYTATPGAGGRIAATDLVPATATTDYDFRSVALNVNVVLRWEYRLGSTLFAVYTRAQDERGFDDGSQPSTLKPHELARGPAVDTFMLKWSYWWSA
jgi:hypothetical protein